MGLISNFISKNSGVSTGSNCQNTSTLILPPQKSFTIIKIQLYIDDIMIMCRSWQWYNLYHVHRCVLFYYTEYWYFERLRGFMIILEKYGGSSFK